MPSTCNPGAVKPFSPSGAEAKTLASEVNLLGPRSCGEGGVRERSVFVVGLAMHDDVKWRLETGRCGTCACGHVLRRMRLGWLIIVKLRRGGPAARKGQRAECREEME